jgi:hypothetical protein
VIDTLPTGRNQFNLGVLIPGVQMSGGNGQQDVGGAVGPETRALIVHGTKTSSQRLTMNGVSLSTMVGGGWGGGAVPNAAGVQEIAIDTAAVTAELATGGVRINFIPKDGGNTFSGTTFFSFANDAMQGENFTDELRARGLAAATSIDKNWDFNPGAGGPIKRDRVWFFGTGRYQGAYVKAPIFFNKNANDPTKWTYEADPARQASNEAKWTDYQVRLTWQAAQRHKIGFLYDQQTFCRCPDAISATFSPEAGQDRRFPLQRPIHLDWTSPWTNRLLLEAAAIDRSERWGNMHLHTNPDYQVNDQMISVLEQSNNLTYRARTTYSNNWNHTFHYRAAASYITGTHAVKVGFNDAWGHNRDTTYALQPIAYRFNNGVPNQITLRSTPYTQGINVDHDMGVFAQDKWTMDRITLAYGIRWDHFRSSFPDLELNPAPLVPGRNLQFPGRDNLRWHDVTPKMAVTWDATGDGRTAVKVTLNKYLEGMGLAGLASNPSPVQTVAVDSSTNRAWTDANRNFIADCDLLTPAANGECGASSNPNFGSARNNTSFDPDIITGSGIRVFDWEFSAGVAREILPRMSLEVGYFRRWYGNFLATDNRSVSASDFDFFNVTAPANADLPEGGGYAVTGVPNLKPAAFGRPEDNFVTLAKNYGKQIEHWNGVDVTLNTRLRNGLLLQAGTSTGKTIADNCEVAAQLPEMLLGTANSTTTMPITSTGTWSPLGFCHQETPFLTQFKGFASYLLPRVDVQVAATFQSLPGPAVAANLTATNALLAASSTLGRPLSGNAANIQVNILEPGALYGERLNQLDFRVGKVIRFGRARTSINLDLYNMLNANTVLTQNNAYGAWRAPQSILDARFAKISAQFDF